MQSNQPSVTAFTAAELLEHQEMSRLDRRLGRIAAILAHRNCPRPARTPVVAVDHAGPRL